MKTIAYYFLALILTFFWALKGTALEYPYKNPFIASLSYSLIQKSADFKEVEPIKLGTTYYPERAKFPIAGDRAWARADLYGMSGKGAPMLVVVPGLGGTASSGFSSIIAETGFKLGYNVLNLPSPFHFTYILAASQSGLPGYFPDDARDLERFIREMLKQTGDAGYHPSSLTLVGFSMGALEAAFLNDSLKNSDLRFKKVILFNPPVDMVYAANTLDMMFAKIRNIGLENAKKLMGYVFNFVYETWSKDVASPNYYSSLKKLRVTEEEMAFLMGAFLKFPIADIICVSQMIDDLGILKTSFSQFDYSDHGAECQSYGVSQYYKTFLIPSLRKRHIDESEDDLFKKASLLALSKMLKTDDSIYLFHSDDDVLIQKSDLDTLSQMMGKRFFRYSYGGHGGNIWFPDVRKDLESVLAR